MKETEQRVLVQIQKALSDGAPWGEIKDVFEYSQVPDFVCQHLLETAGASV